MTLLVGLLLGGLSVLSALLWWQHHTQRRRLRELTAAVHRLRDGFYATRLWMPGSDEPALLAEALNELARHLQERHEARQREYGAHQRLLVEIAHDLRTPLTSIAGYVGALRYGIGDQPQHYLAIIERKTHELNTLVDNLFYLTRLTTGELPLRPTALDLAELLRQTVLSFAPQLEAEQLEVQLNIPDHPCPLVADELALRRIFANLVGNSLRHGTAKTTFGLSLTPDPQSYHITIWDNGVGLSPDLLDQLTAHWNMAHPRPPTSLLHPVSTTGLGLVITTKLLARHGGTLSLESTPHQRTAFTCHLPKYFISLPPPSPSRV